MTKVWQKKHFQILFASYGVAGNISPKDNTDRKPTNSTAPPLSHDTAPGGSSRLSH